MIKRILAVLTTLAMLFSVSAVFAEDAAVPDTLLVTVNGTEIRENNEELQTYYGQLITEMNDPDSEADQHIARMDAMNILVQDAVVSAKIAETIPEEEASRIREEAKATWAEEINAILAENYEITDESSEEERTAALTELLTQLETYYGYTEETFLEDAVYSAFGDIVIAELKEADPSLNASEEDILKQINDEIAQEREETANYALYMKLSGEDPDSFTDEELDDIFQAMTDEERFEYSNDVPTYESITSYYSSYYGYQFHYIPEGYRGVTHILLKVDEELLNAWIDLNARLEEAQEPEAAEDGEEPAETEEPVTAEMVEAARQAILDSQKDTIDEIMGKLENGAAFQDLIAEYGTDPGMQDEDTLKNGYMIHKDSINYDAAFTAAAAALEKVGDYSEPVVSRFGIHILYYLRDIPGGTVEMSEEELAQVKKDIEDEWLNLAISELVDQWIAEADIVWTAEGEAWKEDAAVRDAYLAAQLAEEEAEEETAGAAE